MLKTIYTVLFAITTSSIFAQVCTINQRTAEYIMNGQYSEFHILDAIFFDAGGAGGNTANEYNVTVQITVRRF